MLLHVPDVLTADAPRPRQAPGVQRELGRGSVHVRRVARQPARGPEADRLGVADIG